MMTTVLEQTPRADAEYGAAISQMMTDLKKTIAEMNETQHEIDQRHKDIKEQLTRLKEMFKPCLP